MEYLEGGLEYLGGEEDLNIYLSSQYVQQEKKSLKMSNAALLSDLIFAMEREIKMERYLTRFLQIQIRAIQGSDDVPSPAIEESLPATVAQVP